MVILGSFFRETL